MKRISDAERVAAGHLLGRTVAQAIDALRDEMSADALCPLTPAQRETWVKAIEILQTRINENK